MSDHVDDQISARDSDAPVEPATVTEHYARLRVLLESMETDMLKNSNGNKAAGTRLRKSLRLLKNYSGDFVKFTLASDK